MSLHRVLVSFEGSLTYVLLLLFIWLWQEHYPGLVFAPILVALISWKIRRRGAAHLGLIPIRCTNGIWFMLGILFLMYWGVIALTGHYWNPIFWKQNNLGNQFFQSTLEYIPKAIFQQICMNGYFTNRIHVLTGEKKRTLFYIGILFSLVHLPNPALMVATFFGGVLSAHFFFKTKNNYVIGAIHALLAVSLMYFLPESWHHGLRVGPGYYTWQPSR